MLGGFDDWDIWDKPLNIQEYYSCVCGGETKGMPNYGLHERWCNKFGSKLESDSQILLEKKRGERVKKLYETKGETK